MQSKSNRPFLLYFVWVNVMFRSPTLWMVSLVLPCFTSSRRKRRGILFRILLLNWELSFFLYLSREGRYSLFYFLSSYIVRFFIVSFFLGHSCTSQRTLTINRNHVLTNVLRSSCKVFCYFFLILAKTGT